MHAPQSSSPPPPPPPPLPPQIVHHARRFLLRRRKAGLVAALDTMTTEVMLLGVATLFLSAVERSVGGACVPAKDLGLSVWADFVTGCACCLPKTAGTSDCFVRDRGCAAVAALGACCAALPGAESAASHHLRGLTCPLASLAGVVGIDAVDGAAGAGAADPHRRSLLAPGGAVAAAAGGAGLHFCEGAVESGIGGCPPGRRPAISIDAMHQVHIFIFYLALIHIAASCAVAVLASLRIREWRAWDRAAVRVERGLFREACAASAVVAADADAVKKKEEEEEGEPGGVVPAAGSDVEAGPPAVRGPPPPPPTRPTGLTKPPPALPGSGGGGRALVRSGGPSVPATPFVPSSANRGGGGDASVRDGAGAPHPPTEAELPDAFIPATYLGPHAGTAPWRGRAGDFGEPGAGTTLLARLWEAACCAAIQFAPNVVTRREWHLMRASFLDTHRVGAHRGRAFDFAAYTSASVDGDFAAITGLGWTSWVLLVGFVALSAAIGWAVWLLVAGAGALLLLVNTKLVAVVRHVTRGGQPHTLDPGAFWLGRPWLLLPAIKAAVFLIALLWTNTLFFATQFGRHSCFFASTGFTRSPAPWWVVTAVSVALFFILALNTMPMFSLTVQMGADVKADAIPDGLKAHFAAVGADLASRRRARAAAAGVQSRISRMSRALSTHLPRRADALSKEGDL